VAWGLLGNGEGIGSLQWAVSWAERVCKIEIEIAIEIEFFKVAVGRGVQN